MIMFIIHLELIFKKSFNNVVYLNPRDIKHPIGLNLLELPDDLDEDELLVEQERVTEAVVSVLRKVFALFRFLRTRGLA